MPRRYRNLAASVFFFSLALTVILTGSLIVWGMPAWSSYLSAISLITFVCFGWDKYQAKQSRQRVPENCLHALAFIGGSPGSLVGQRFFRHKSSKKAFQQIYWGIVVLQILIVITIALKQ
jgi:uncharacterized membrane protein YsdA (DUF1294 family)